MVSEQFKENINESAKQILTWGQFIEKYKLEEKGDELTVVFHTSKDVQEYADEITNNFVRIVSNRVEEDCEIDTYISDGLLHIEITLRD